MIEQADGTVGPAQHQIAFSESARLLQRGRVAEASDFTRIRNPVIKHIGRVPGGGDHPIGALVSFQWAGNGDQRIDMPAQEHRIDRMAISFGPNLPNRAGDFCAFVTQLPQQGRQKGQTRWK